MKISASIQAANQLNIIEDIKKNKTKFDQIHVDITDGHFTNNISMSFQHIKEVKNQTNYKVDVQLMVENNVKLAPLAFEHGADLVCIHCESTDLNDLTKCFFPFSLIKGITPLEKLYVYSPKRALNCFANLEVPQPLSFAA